jgi:hypothetical protein
LLNIGSFDDGLEQVDRPAVAASKAAVKTPGGFDKVGFDKLSKPFDTASSYDKVSKLPKPRLKGLRLFLITLPP